MCPLAVAETIHIYYPGDYEFLTKKSNLVTVMVVCRNE